MACRRLANAIANRIGINYTHRPNNIMSSPENEPVAVAAPRRGKFLPAPAPSSQAAEPNAPPPPPQTRGKFLGKAPKSTASNNLQAASTTGDADHDSIDSLRTYVHSSKLAAASRRKLIAAQRQSVIDDLEEAENIVVSLLDIASDVAGALSDMTTAKSKTIRGEKSENSFEDLSAKVSSSGAGYLAGVKRLHKLLAPHSTYVKSLNKHDDEDNTDSEGNSKKSLVAPNSTFSKIVVEATSNMHAVRVKKRLAVERCDIMKEMIRLQEEEECRTKKEVGKRGEDDSQNSDTAGSKRKHDSIEH